MRDKDFNAPLPAAQVMVVGTDKKTKTSDQGNYVLEELPPGKYTLVFSKDGYIRQVRADVVVSPGRLTELDVALAGDFTDMEEFIVSDVLGLGAGTERALLALRFNSPSLIDSISAELMSRAGASDAADALKVVSGASVKDGKSAVIRGLPDRYVSSQLNGVRLPTADEDKRAVELDQFPSAVIQDILVSKTFTPDQQGDASGGAVNVRLKGIPNEPFFFKYGGEVKYKTQVTGRSRFLTYDGGGVSFSGRDAGRRSIQIENLGRSWIGAAGVSEAEAPLDYKFSFAGGGRHEFDGGLKVGGFVSVFYERSNSFFDNGIDDSLWVEQPGAEMTPKAFQGSVQDGDFKTNLFDVTQSSQSVQWGGLATFGVEFENHSLNLVYLLTHTADDKATLAEDTRGKHHFFPDYDPDDSTTNGHNDPDAAPYLRLETLEYTERTTDSLQLNGRHTLPDLPGFFREPEFGWVLSRSTASLDQPDKRQFGSVWQPGRNVGSFFVPPTHSPFKPSANFTLGNQQRIWKLIDEESMQVACDLKLPFEQWTKDEGYFKLGFFGDRVDRTFDQDTFSNFGDNSSYVGQWQQFWSKQFRFENHPITESLFDVDYEGELDITALYAMVDLPIVSSLNLIAGVRHETTEISIVNDPEENATWFPPGSLTQTRLNPGDADVAFSDSELLPSLALVYTPIDNVTVRLSYNETTARQTFKELTPILQQEFLGGPIFIGNSELRMSSVQNYDLRVDYTPYDGGLFSASIFRKLLRDPIEYVQRVSSFDFTTAVNYPRGKLSGLELETRHRLGELFEPLSGLTIGANATFINSRVTLPEDEAAGFDRPGIEAPLRFRDMSNAPELLYNLFFTYDSEWTGTKIGLFYTVQGDTLLAGAGESKNNFVPSVYQTEIDTLNFSLSQSLGKGVFFRFQAKNLTDPKFRTAYRSEFVGGGDITQSSFTRGIDYSISIGGEIRL